MQRDTLARILVTDRIQPARQIAVVQRLAGEIVVFQQRHIDHARGEIRTDELADLPGLSDILLHERQVGFAAAELVKNHRAGTQTIRRHRDPARVRSPERSHVRAIDAGQQIDLIADTLQHGKIMRVDDRAMIGRHGNTDRVLLRLQIIVVLEIVHDERMMDRQHAVVAGIQRRLRRLESQKQRQKKAAKQNDEAIVEQ